MRLGCSTTMQMSTCRLWSGWKSPSKKPCQHWKSVVPCVKGLGKMRTKKRRCSLAYTKPFQVALKTQRVGWEGHAPHAGHAPFAGSAAWKRCELVAFCPSLAAHYVQVLKCRQQCVLEIATKPGRISATEDFIPSHLDLLHFAYDQGEQSHRAAGYAAAALNSLFASGPGGQRVPGRSGTLS